MRGDVRGTLKLSVGKLSPEAHEHRGDRVRELEWH